MQFPLRLLPELGNLADSAGSSRVCASAAGYCGYDSSSLPVTEGAGIIVSTYNEPLITAEWSAAIFKQAKAAGLMTGFVSNGYGTPEALKYLRPTS